MVFCDSESLELLSLALGAGEQGWAAGPPLLGDGAGARSGEVWGKGQAPRSTWVSWQRLESVRSGQVWGATWVLLAFVLEALLSDTKGQ